jgi:hypothetical protein
MNTSNCIEHPKKQEDVARMKVVKQEEAETGNSSTDRVSCSLWDWARLPNLCTTWMEPLVKVKNRSLWVLMTAALTLLVLVEAHPKLQSFVRLCAWSMLLLGIKPPLLHCPAFIVWLAKSSFKSSSKNEKTLCYGFKDLYRSQVSKNPIVIPQAAHQALRT